MINLLAGEERKRKLPRQADSRKNRTAGVLLTNFARRLSAERIMWASLVVFDHPPVRGLPQIVYF